MQKKIRFLAFALWWFLISVFLCFQWSWVIFHLNIWEYCVPPSSVYPSFCEAAYQALVNKDERGFSPSEGSHSYGENKQVDRWEKKNGFVCLKCQGEQREWPRCQTPQGDRAWEASQAGKSLGTEARCANTHLPKRWSSMWLELNRERPGRR